jgi:hypothetical protein
MGRYTEDASMKSDKRKDLFLPSTSNQQSFVAVMKASKPGRVRQVDVRFVQPWLIWGILNPKKMRYGLDTARHIKPLQLRIYGLAHWHQASRDDHCGGIEVTFRGDSSDQYPPLAPGDIFECEITAAGDGSHVDCRLGIRIKTDRFVQIVRQPLTIN